MSVEPSLPRQCAAVARAAAYVALAAMRAITRVEGKVTLSSERELRARRVEDGSRLVLARFVGGLDHDDQRFDGRTSLRDHAANFAGLAPAPRAGHGHDHIARTGARGGPRRPSGGVELEYEVRVSGEAVVVMHADGCADFLDRASSSRLWRRTAPWSATSAPPASRARHRFLRRYALGARWLARVGFARCGRPNGSGRPRTRARSYLWAW